MGKEITGNGERAAQLFCQLDAKPKPPDAPDETSEAAVWVRTPCSATGAFYFVHKVTGEAQWEVPEELAQTREDLRRRAKKKLDNAIDLLQEAMREQKAIGRRRLEKLRDEALRLDDPVASGRSASPQELVQGARVRVALGGEGELREVRGTRAIGDVFIGSV